MMFFRIRKLLKQINATIVTLILKVSKPANASQFRLISCYNVLYKCISKVLYGRLSSVLPDLMNNTQETFVKDKSLLHNTVMCHDIFRHFYRRTSPRCLMKIDLKRHMIITCVATTIKVSGINYDILRWREGSRKETLFFCSYLY